MKFSRIGAVAGLLLVFVSTALISLRLESVTFDETAHIPAGLTYLQTGDLRLNAEHPPLVKAVSAIPALKRAMKRNCTSTPMPYAHC